MSSSPQRERPATVFGPCELPPRLENPSVASDAAATLATLEPIGEDPIIQKLSTDAHRFTFTGKVDRLRHINALDRLVEGGPFKVIADRLDSGEWCFAERVSTSAVRAFPAKGQPMWDYEISLVKANTAFAETIPLPQEAHAAAGRPNPPPRRRPGARFGNIQLPAPLDQPAVAIDSEAELSTHELLGRQALPRWMGVSTRHVSAQGSCFREQALRFDRLAEGDGITVVTDRFKGNAIVESVSTSPSEGFFEQNPDRPGQVYNIELKQVMENVE